MRGFKTPTSVGAGVIPLSTSSTHPYNAFNFIVEIGSKPAAGFEECILPAASIEVLEYREGIELTTNVHKLPGLVRYGNLVLKRGLTDSMDLWTWFDSIVSGAGTTQDVVVTLRDATKNPAVMWKFKNCWPVKYEPSPLNATRSGLAIETLELAVDGMEIAPSPSQTT